MILSDKSILEEMDKGNIIISPFNRDYLNPNSVDLTLGNKFKIYLDDVLDTKKENRVYEFEIDESGMVLNPGSVYLYACNEKIGVRNNIRAKVEGKSSLGRLGLFVHVTAGFIDSGFEGSLVLELVATQKIRLYPNMKICQVEFARTEDVLESYDQKKGSKYMNQTGVQESLNHLNFKINEQ